VSEEMEKSPEAFRTISEVAESMDLPQHVLRFWETRFPQIRPLKRAGGRRYYRPDDVERLRLIKRLLYDEGYTIKGVQKLFRQQGVQALTGGTFEPRLFPGPDEPGVETPESGEFGDIAPEPAATSAIPSVTPEEPLDDVGRPSAEDLATLKVALAELVEAARILDRARSGER
jgi:DNA-binding transcriptional MerR regulator